MPTWTCTTCQKLITGPGWLWIDPRVALDVVTAREEWKKRRRPSASGAIMLGDYLTFPAPAKWHVTHENCTPSEDDESYGFMYSISMTDARSYQRLLWWTTHLESKNWLTATNWRDLMQAAAEQPAAAA